MRRSTRHSGGNSQDRRRARRAAERRTSEGAVTLLPDDVAEIQALVAAASDSHAGDAAEVVEVGVPDDSEVLVVGAGLTADERAQLAEVLATVEVTDSATETPEDLALGALEAYQAAVRCSCGHPFSDHEGANGACGHGDGRGTCSCGAFSYPSADPDPAAIAEAYLAQHPELAPMAAQVEKVVRHALRAVSLQAAAGDVAWGPEEGFVDLLCDVNEILGRGSYGDDCVDGCWPGPLAVDVSVNLDKVKICDGDDWYVAPITIDAAGEPVLSDRAEWIPAEDGALIESAPDDDEMTASAKMRFALRDFVVAAGAAAPPLPAELEPSERLPDATDAIEAPEQTVPAGGDIRWTATFVPEGVLTEDGRAFAPGSLILPPAEEARQLPLTLMGMIETTEGGHIGAKVTGRIDQMWREGNLVKAAGVFSEEEWGQMIARMVASGELRGLSVDIAPLEWEHAPASAWFDEAGNWIAERDENGDWVPAGGEATLEDAVERLFGGGEDTILVITKAVIGMATVCPFPAFGDASISLVSSGGADLYQYTGQAGFTVVREKADCGCETLTAAAVADTAVDAPAPAAPGETDSLTASAAGLAPELPPAEWFDDPQFEELTPMTITDDGRIFGHAWAWDTCHVSFDGCVTAPESETGYAYFELGEIECEGGEKLPVGKITLDAPHAGQRLSRSEATRHYDHTGTVVAYVRFGEDEHGGWFAGTVRPDLPASKLRLLRGATVSGDWRGVDGNLELIALLAVNVPGFAVPRQRALVAAAEVEGGAPEVLSLVAAGIVAPLLAEQAEEIAALVADAEAA